MSYQHKYGVPATTEPLSPQEEFSIADDILVRRTMFDGFGSAPTRYLFEAFGEVVPTVSNCPLPCPATFTQTDATTSKFYVAVGATGSVCTGWTEIT